MLKSPYNINPGATFTSAAVEALRTQLHHLYHNLDGTMEGDVEALHDMRVASRRLRAAMSVFGSAFAPKQFRPLERDAARVTDSLGGVRDADVQIEYLTKLRDRAMASQKVGLNALIEYHTGEREKARKDMIKDLERLSRSTFRDDFERMLDENTNDRGAGESGVNHG
jgi:CHAD domain-containing protein